MFCHHLGTVECKFLKVEVNFCSLEYDKWGEGWMNSIWHMFDHFCTAVNSWEYNLLVNLNFILDKTERK